MVITVVALGVRLPRGHSVAGSVRTFKHRVFRDHIFPKTRMIRVVLLLLPCIFGVCLFVSISMVSQWKQRWQPTRTWDIYELNCGGEHSCSADFSRLVAWLSRVGSRPVRLVKGRRSGKIRFFRYPTHKSTRTTQQAHGTESCQLCAALAARTLAPWLRRFGHIRRTYTHAHTRVNYGDERVCVHTCVRTYLSVCMVLAPTGIG